MRFTVPLVSTPAKRGRSPPPRRHDPFRCSHTRSGWLARWLTATTRMTRPSTAHPDSLHAALALTLADPPHRRESSERPSTQLTASCTPSSTLPSLGSALPSTSCTRKPSASSLLRCDPSSFPPEIDADLAYPPNRQRGPHIPRDKPYGRIAIIGAGLTGVSTAAHAVDHGFEVVIFEAEQVRQRLLAARGWRADPCPLSRELAEFGLGAAAH